MKGLASASRQEKKTDWTLELARPICPDDSDAKTSVSILI